MCALASFRRAGAALLCLAAFCASLTAEAVRNDVPREGLLVLANGSIIEGVIALEGDYYKVVLPKGKLQVRIDQVDFLCANREEAYIRRRARKIATTSTADAHLDLARWCLQNELLACGEAEIAAARALDPQHWHLRSVERQFAEAKSRADRADQPTLQIDDQVVPASAVVETSRPLGEVPTWARTEFIKRIQPMMAQSCATSGCHLPDTGQRMQVDRLALDGVGNPDLIHRNMASIITTIDFAEPDKSELLLMGAATHGPEGKHSKPLTPHQLEILRAWVTQLAMNEAPPEPVDESPVTQIVVGLTSGSQRNYPAGMPIASVAPDPFDPAEFNQAHDAGSESVSAEATAAAADSPTESAPQE